MTRRERLLSILDNFGGLNDRSVKWELDCMLTKRNAFDLFTDDAIEMLTAAVIKSWRYQRRLNRENRKLRAAS